MESALGRSRQRCLCGCCAWAEAPDSASSSTCAVLCCPQHFVGTRPRSGTSYRPVLEAFAAGTHGTTRVFAAVRGHPCFRSIAILIVYGLGSILCKHHWWHSDEPQFLYVCAGFSLDQFEPPPRLRQARLWCDFSLHCSSRVAW